MSHRPDPNRSVSYYPALLELTGRPVVVVGGGEVAEQKTAGLLAAGARITIVAPTLTADLARWVQTDRLSWASREYREGDLAGAFLAFTATDDTTVNQRVWEEAEWRRIPINAADDPPRCSFILPAVHRDGDLVVAVSTGGKAPALAVRLRDRVAQLLGTGYAEYLDLLAGFRPRVVDRFSTFAGRRDVWYRIVDSPALDHLRGGRHDAARRVISDVIDDTDGRGAA